MLKNVLISAVVASLVLLSGCSSKKVDVAEQPTAKSDSSKDAASSSVGSTQTADGKANAISDAGSTADAAAKALEQAQGSLKSVLFDYDKYFIRADMQPVVEEGTKTLADKAVADTNIKLEGNADERGSDEYNTALGLKRATSVKAALVAKGIADGRISMVTLGEGNPVCKEHNEECWQKNRRVDFKLEAKK